MDEVVPADGDRVERERRFHDERFTDDSARAAAGRFYELVGGATARFEQVLDSVGGRCAGPRVRVGDRRVRRLGLAGRGVRVDGIDISPVAVELANAAAVEAGLGPDELHYEVMDAEHLTFPDDTFDVVFGSGILHHLDLGRALDEIARVLVDGGVAVFFEPMGHNPAINLYRRLTPQMRTPDEHPLVVDDFARARQSFGDVTTDIHVLSVFGALPFRRTRRFGDIIGRLEAVDGWLFRKVPASQRYGWIVVLELRRPLDRHLGATRPA